MFRLLSLLLFLCFSFSPAYAKPIIRSVEGTVTKVSDGDTINVNSEVTKLKVRLYGIDAPETEKINRRTGKVSKFGQPYGEDAYRALLEKISGKKVKLDILDIDRYRRIVSVVWHGSRNINKEMVAEGWAWAYRKYLDGPYASEFMHEE